MFSLFFKSIVTPHLSPALSLLPLLGFVISLLPALASQGKDQRSAGFTPSRATGISTKVTLLQEPAGNLTTGLLILICALLAVVAGASQWARTPRSKRLSKAPSPPPPPPSPPPVADAPHNTDADDEEDAERNDGGDDDPQEDGAGAQDENGRDEDGLATAAAPAPEDPPPPPGGIEEHADDAHDSCASDSPLLWLVGLLIGKLAMGLFSRKQVVKPSFKVDSAKRDIVKPTAPTVQRPASSRIPGLLERQVRVVNGDPALEFCAAPKPPSFIAGLLQRRPQPVPPPVPHALIPPALRQDLLPVLPVMAQHTWDAPSPRALLSSIVAVLRRVRLPWRKVYTLVVVLPALAFLGVVAIIIVLLPRATPIPADAQALPEAPPPDPHDMRDRIRVALFRHTPATEADKATRAQAVQLLQRAAARRAARPAPVDEQDDLERERVQRVRELQRRVWRLMWEQAKATQGREQRGTRLPIRPDHAHEYAAAASAARQPISRLPTPPSFALFPSASEVPASPEPTTELLAREEDEGNEGEGHERERGGGDGTCLMCMHPEFEPRYTALRVYSANSPYNFRPELQQNTSQPPHPSHTHYHVNIAIIMFFSSFVSAALMMLSGVTALPQPENGALMSRNLCASGYYFNFTPACAPCPAGHFCDGASGQVTPCPAGTYQPYTTKNFCYGAPKGRFQSQAGQRTVCGTCCGWSAPLVNNNISPVNCTGKAPNAWPSSGDGCISGKTNCVRAVKCEEKFNATSGFYDCPAETIVS
ncbi:hypothetical protein DFH09DRAFT_1305017 [Mycena vulgaris]|nr:hypothetical protein DFH09DRAFT_1305017 [Mycena vulgaris]